MSEVNLHSTTDASVWAKEFCKNWPTALSQVPGREGVETEEDFEGIMIGWFANAIMAGVDSVVRQLPRDGAESGWTIDPHLLMEVTHEINREGWDASLEAVELAMIAAERIFQDHTND